MDPAATNTVELSILMPCLDEAETLDACIHQAQSAIDKSGVPGEIIVADNGSTDGSREIALRAGARVVDVPARGYGAALWAGVNAARGTYILMGDADGSYDFSSAPAFLEKLRGGADLVMGNRFAGGIRPGAMPWSHRVFGNPVLTAIGRLFFRCPVGDMYCGLRAFRRDAVIALDLRSTGMEFALEMVVKATLRGLRIEEIPATLSQDGRSRPPHLRTWRDGWRSLRFFLLYSPRWLFLFPGLLLMVLGLATSAWLLPGERRLGGAVLDVHTLFYAAFAVIVGFQAVVFSVFTRIFAASEGLLPESRALDRLFKWVTLETGLAAGGALILAGLAGSIYAVAQWGAGEFSHLDYGRGMRIVIPSGLAVALGVQVALSSFFISVLGLKRR